MRQYRLGHPGRVVAVVLGREVCRRPRDLGDGRDDAVDAEPGELPLRGEAEVAALVGGERRAGKPDIHSATSPQGLPRNLLVTASPVSASSAQTVVDLRCTSIPKAVEYLGTGASQPRCGAAAPLALQQHCRSPDPRSRAGAPVVSVPLDWVIVSDPATVHKLVRKTKKVDEYRAAVERVFREQPLAPIARFRG